MFKMRRSFFTGGVVVGLVGAWWFGVREPPPIEEEITEDVWIGKLTDWDCKERDPEPPCPVDSRTTNFALVVDGGIILRLDERGSELARKAVAAARAGGNLAARVVGVRVERVLEVEEVELVGR